MKTLLKLALITVLTFSAADVYSQAAGVKLGLSMANVNIKDGDELIDEDQRLLFAPKFGFLFESPLHEEIFLQAGIYITAGGFTFDSERFVEKDSMYKESVEKFILMYLEVPINVGYKHQLNDNVSVFGMAGPVFKYMPYSTLAFKVDGEWDNTTTHIGEGDAKVEMFNTFDLGINIEAGIQLGFLQLSLYYNPCFINVFNEDFAGPDAKWKNYSFGFNLAVLFGNTSGGSNHRYRR